MVRTETPVVDRSFMVPEFELPGVDGKSHRLEDVRGENGLLIIFMCNHCPYVKAVEDRILRDVRDLKELGIGTAAIMSNDPTDYPEDSFENLRARWEEKAYPMPYLFDETQEVAKRFGAVCTPDFFGFNASGYLQYRGRLDESRKEPVTGAKRELFEGMKQVAQTGQGPEEQIPSMGCSIKWKDDG
ncbi:thioredoxin family protein [Thiohalorhabdus sp. Cl-TMA]|uniref:Thioredoxin family protein n=1 Tax=Thiohalorhabdus methylotrophus TaxID=3242694 RepID=A0ABV4TTK4_9GAMM